MCEKVDQSGLEPEYAGYKAAILTLAGPFFKRRREWESNPTGGFSTESLGQFIRLLRPQAPRTLSFFLSEKKIEPRTGI